jgi:membrane-associated protease RseP (regulator of RpoE activity)
MLNINFLAGTSLALLCACAGASAQDTQPAPKPAPRLLLRQAPPQGGAMLAGPRMREGGPRLGVTVDTTPDGLKVTTIDDGSLAASAGIKADDVLMRIGEHRVHAVDDVALALHGTEPGAKVSITVIRPGEGLVTLEGTLPEAKEEPKASAPDGMKGGFLGVQMKSEAEDGGQPGAGGVAVAGVVPDSAAWFAGLEEGDRLMSIDGKALANAEDLAGTVASKEPGSMVELRFVRNGEEQTTKVRLGHRGMLGMFGGMGQPGGARGPGILRLRAPQQDGDAVPFGYDVDQPDGQFFQMDDGDFSLPGFPDLQQFFSNPQDGAVESVEVHIDGDHMTVTHDGATETYERDADGNWIKQDGATPAPQEPHGA